MLKNIIIASYVTRMSCSDHNTVCIKILTCVQLNFALKPVLAYLPPTCLFQQVTSAHHELTWGCLINFYCSLHLARELAREAGVTLKKK